MTPEQALLRLYQRAARQLRRDIARALARDAIGTARYQQQQHAAVIATLRILERRMRALALDASAGPYQAAALAVDRALFAQVAPRLERAHREERAYQAARVEFRFTGSHQRAALAIAERLVSRLASTHDTVGRRTDDAFRRVGLEQVALGLITGASRRDVSQRVAQALIDEAVTDALTGLVDSRGRRWQLDTYGEMVARTTTREAISAGTEARMRETGRRLVKISTHPDSCPLCKPFDGGTFALPGLRVEGYETLLRLPPWHPNCRHVAAPADDEAAFLAALAAAMRKLTVRA